MFHRIDDAEAPVLVKSTDFTFSESPTATLLTAVEHRSYVPSGEGYDSAAMPPVEFTYSAATLNDAVRDVEVGALENAPEGLDGDRYRWVDLDQEGLAGLLTEQGGQWYYKRNLGEGKLGALEPLPSLPSVAGMRQPSQAPRQQTCSSNSRRVHAPPRRCTAAEGSPRRACSADGQGRWTTYPPAA